MLFKKATKDNQNNHYIAIVAGGTGGHIFPALELAKALKKKGVQLIWLGQPNSLESKIAYENGIEFIGTKLNRIRGENLVRKVFNSFNLLILVHKCSVLVKGRYISKTIVFGGYVSFAFALALKINGSEIYIHEQNSIAGMANWILRPIAKKIFIGFKGSFKGKKVVLVGNPIRHEILEIKKDYQSFNPKKSINILVFGGSLGAVALNKNIPWLISKQAKKYPIRIIHQYGRKDVPPFYQKCQSVKTYEFIDNMKWAYDWADMVICRSGAMSVSEVEAVGVFTLFIPYPYAVSNHQYFNAKNSTHPKLRFVLNQSQLNEFNFNEIFKKLIDLQNEKDRNEIKPTLEAKKLFYKNTLSPIIDILI